MNWLITGGCGFIGTKLIQRLQKQDGHYIRIIDNLSVGTQKDLAAVCSFAETGQGQYRTSHKEVELVIGDIRDANLALQISQGIDVLVHLAANTGVSPSVQDPRTDCECNVIGTLNYLEAARINGIKRFIFASSSAPAGEVEPPINEELPPHPVSPYGASKLAGEGYCSAYFRTFGIDTICLRFGNVYGPGSLHKNSVVAKFIKHALQGEPLEIYGDGNQTRDFIYIDDLVEAVWRASTMEGIGGEIFQIASNRETTVNELAQMLIKIFNDHGFVRIAVAHGETRRGDMKRNYSDTSKARRLLIWEPQYDLEKGLSKTIAFFLQTP